MSKIMVVNVTHSEESRVGVLKDGTLEAFEIEALSREHLKGNIYKGLVRRIHPALEAAFVDIGAERDAFLPLDEICFRNLPRPLPPPNNGGGDRRRRRVREILRPGEELLVQIVKEQFGNKPPTLTTFYSLPGRYLVLLPGSDDAGISRRIEGDERQRIRNIINDLQPPEGYGIIVRTAAGFDEDVAELGRDLSVLQRLWENVKRASDSARAPALVYREHDIVLRTIRDYFTPEIDEIHVDNEEVYHRARTFLQEVMPGRETVLRLYTDGQPIFSAFNIEAQIESIFKRRVPLRSGGSIVIDTAEALTAIDVNSGGSVRGPNPEETAFRTNIEACREIARQLRLRDIGGIIVVDFIDMREPEHIQEVERTIRDAMRIDKARHEIGRISRLGLLEISRQRIRPAAMATTYASCPMCEGHGAIRTTESAALVALRKLHNRVAQGDVAAVRLSLPPDVSLYLLNQKRDDLAQLETRYSCKIQVLLSDKLMPHQMEMDTRTRQPLEVQAERLAPGAVAEVAAAQPTNGNVPAEAAKEVPPAAAGDGSKRRRRRGGRRGKTRRAALALADALTSFGAHAGFVAAAAEHGHDAIDPEGSVSDAAHTASRETTQGATTETNLDLSSLTPEAAAGVGESAPSNLGPAPESNGRRRRRSRGGRRHRGRRQGAVAADATAGRSEASAPPSPPPVLEAPISSVPRSPGPAFEAASSNGEAAPLKPRRTRSTGARKSARAETAATKKQPKAAAPRKPSSKRATSAPRRPTTRKRAPSAEKPADE